MTKRRKKDSDPPKFAPMYVNVYGVKATVGVVTEEPQLLAVITAPMPGTMMDWRSYLYGYVVTRILISGGQAL